MRSKRCILAAALAGLAGGVLGLSSAASAADYGLPAPEALTLSPSAQASEQTADAAKTAAADSPVFLADMAAAEEKPNIHGFIEVPFRTSYITPRGLVVENQGLVIQPVGGIVFPIGDIGPMKNFTFVTGVWNSINSHQGDTNVGPWNEMDYFASFSGSFDKLTATFTYGAWNFPQSTVFKPSTEHNIDLKLAYDDTDLHLLPFALHPYVDFFYELGGSSTVAFGKNGETGYAEIGVVPTYKLEAISSYPVTFTFPTYFSVGPAEYWGRGGTVGGLSAKSDGNLGVFSAAVQASIPLSFIPARLGYWHVDGGLTYFHLFNDALLNAGTFLSGNTQRDILQGSLGFGVNF